MSVVSLPGAADLEISGPLDVTTAAAVRIRLNDALDACVRDGDVARDLVVDLAGLEAIDMVGLGVLVGVHRQAQRRGRRLVLCAVPPRVMRLLAVTRLRRVFTVIERSPARGGEAGSQAQRTRAAV